MRRSASYAFSIWLLLFAVTAFAFAQSPVGTISGTTLDPSGAAIRNASITIRNKTTSAERKLKSDEDGTFSAPSLPAGEYEVTAKANGFRTLLQEVTVSTGSVLKVEMKMEIGQTTEIVTIEGAGAAQLNYESHSIDGVITRQKIQELPLNGRSFLQLAFLEPGVTASPGSTSQYNSLFSVSILGGASNKTAITVDGGNIRNSIEGNTGMNFSQEVVQEFQLSANNFDLSTGITSVGAVNIVSRTGGNEFHGSGYFFFRDHNMAAYPGLRRICQEPSAPALCSNTAESKAISDPFFARRNPGVWIGGPIIKNRLFFFSNYEYTNQAGVVTVQPDLPSISGLAGNFATPYSGHLFSLRLDWKASNKHNVFARYSHDQNKGFGPNGGSPLPSNWLQNKNFSDQTVLGITSSLRPTLVNDFRFNYTYWQNRNLFADQSVCPNCLGLGSFQIQLQGSSNFAVGNTSNATQGRDLRRFTFTDNLTWQKGSHRLRFGTEIEHAPGTGFWGFCDPGCTSLASPEFVKGLIPSALLPAFFPNLPSVIRTNADLLNLPFLGAVIGIGDPSQPPPYNIDKAKQNNRLRFYGQDTWKIKPSFTFNYGLAWNFESTLVNTDLPKPKLLAPLYGSDLSATKNNYNNFSPSVGFAWNLDKNNKTVVRGGAGLYWDTELLYRRLQERAYIGPIGNGRVQYPSTSGFTNIFPGIVDFGAGGKPVPVGASIPQSLTNMTLGQFLQIYNQQIGAITQALAPKNLNDLSVVNIQLSKSGTQLYPHDYPVQHTYQMNLGIQRDLGHDMVISADYARRVFLNVLLDEIDLNRYQRRINGVQTPVIPICSTAAQRNDPTAQCSTGAITFWIPGGRGTYDALLVKLDKRFSKRFLFTASYALSSQRGINGIQNLDNYFQTYGPQGGRHLLNVSGLVDLPWGFQASFISSSSSRGPLTPSINGIDLDGDGSSNTPLPGIKSYNCFNRNCGKSDLETAVLNWNNKYFPDGVPQSQAAYTAKDARGQTIPYLILPQNYEFGDNFNSQDLRLTKTFKWKENYKLSVFGEMFNIFNFANLGGYSFQIPAFAPDFTKNADGTLKTAIGTQLEAQRAKSIFGQPTSRANQVFGSGGPRALQLGARVTF